MSDSTPNLAELLEDRRFGDRMSRALRLVAQGISTHEAAAAVGLATHQDVAKAAIELGIGSRHPERARPWHPPEQDAA